MSDLEALAVRCEREEPSVDVRVAIGIALVWRKEFFIRGSTDYLMVDPQGRKMLAEEMPAWESSLDAAVTLRPEGWRLRNMDEGDPASRHLPTSVEIIPLYGDDALWKAYEQACGTRHRLMGFGKTLALAICAAALRARAAMVKAEGAVSRKSGEAKE